jgi:hypothetical protein
MTKETLINKIRTAFKDVRLEDGIGLWEGQGVDDYADEKTMLALRKRDERNNWDNMPYKDLMTCYSSLSFFDAKGMRFCLPQFLIFDILDSELGEQEDLHAPDVLFTLGYKLDEEYQRNRFSLLNQPQIVCIVDYLEYKLSEVIHTDYFYGELNRTIGEWKQKLDE